MPPRRVELGPEDIHGPLGRRDGQHVAELAQAHVLSPVVHGGIVGQLHQRALAIAYEIRDVVAGKRCVIVEPGLHEEVHRVPRERSGRSPEAARPLAGGLHDAVKRPEEDGPLFLPGQLVDLLVQVSVVRDLMPVLDNECDGPRILLHAPSGNEERLAKAEPLERVDDPRHRHLRPVPKPGCHGHAVVRRVREIDVEQALRVHIEREVHRAPGSVRPLDGVLDHRVAAGA